LINSERYFTKLNIKQATQSSWPLQKIINMIFLQKMSTILPFEISIHRNIDILFVGSQLIYQLLKKVLVSTFVMALGAYVRGMPYFCSISMTRQGHTLLPLRKSLVIFELARFVIRTFYEHLVMEG
jgi:uncharacterized membrane protein YfbV (UPF0208 family)